MKLFFYILKLRLNHIVSLGMARPAVGAGINILITLITLLYGMAAALFYQYLADKQLLTHFSFLSFLHLFLFTAIIVASFFPQYKPFSFLFFTAYPLKSRQKAIFQLVYSFIAPLYVYLLLFILSLYITAGNSFSLPEPITTCLCITNSYLVLQIIKIQLQGRFYVAESILAVLLSVTLLYLNQYSSSATFMCPAAAVILLLLSVVFIRLYTLLETQEPPSHKTSRQNRSEHNATLAFLRKKTVFPGFLIAVILKLLYSALVIIGLSRHKMDTDFSRILFPLICSPVIYFTYIFNNFFGYQRQQIIYIGYINTTSRLFGYFFTIIAPILLLDCIISGLLLYCTGTFSAGFTLSYLLLTGINCIIIGFSLSIMLPQKITKSIDIKKPTNTNFPGSIVLVVLTILAIQLKETYWLLLQETLLMTAFILFYFYYLKKNETRIYTSLANNII